MTRLAPIYDDHGERFQADACQPLIKGVDQGTLDFQAMVHGHYPGVQLADDSLPELKSVGHWDAPVDQDWGLPWHRNEGIEFTYCETGHVALAADDDRFTLRPDDFAITRPWQRHRVGMPHVSASRLHWVILDVGVRRPNQKWRWPPWIVLASDDLGELTQRLLHNEQMVRHGNDEMRDCVRRLARAVAVGDAQRVGSRIAVLLNELLLLLLELLRARNEPLDRQWSGGQRTVELFLQDLTNSSAALAQEWTVHRMAQACGMRATQFTKYCRLATNSTPAKFLQDCRLQAAARQLTEHPEQTITEVAHAHGFSSTQYFATLFRGAFGQTPTDYRWTRPCRLADIKEN